MIFGKATSKPTSLQDFNPIEAQSESGVLFCRDNKASFMLELSGTDASFFEENDWSRLHDVCRSILRLDRAESLQFVFSKRCDFENYFEDKFKQMDLVQNAFTRKLFLYNLNEIAKNLQLERPALFTTKNQSILPLVRV